jgi:hypothetical protein
LPATQAVGLAALDDVDDDDNEPSFLEDRSAGEDSPGEPSSSRTGKAKSKFQPLMPTHREEAEDDIGRYLTAWRHSHIRDMC